MTGLGVLRGVIQHVGAELSAHEAIAAEQERWGSIQQLAAEYETIAASAQRDRWASLIRASGLTSEQSAAAIESDAFGPLTAELRRAEAHHHNVDSLLTAVVRALDFADADDIAAVLISRLTRSTARAQRAGLGRRTPRLIAGLIPEALGSMSDEMRRALHERRDLIERRADWLVSQDVRANAAWLNELGSPSSTEVDAVWRRHARVVAAYRDRYGVTGRHALGAEPGSTSQREDARRARAAIYAARREARGSDFDAGRRKRAAAGRSAPSR